MKAAGSRRRNRAWRISVLVKRLLFFAVLIVAPGCHNRVSVPLGGEERPAAPSLHQVELGLPPVRERISLAKRYVEVVAGGDVMLGHWTLEYLQREGADYPFRKIRHLFDGADIVFANLEAPFADSGTAAEKAFTFRVPTQYASALRDVGFNFVSLANNHILDYGLDGLQQTLQALQRNGLAWAGAGLTRDAAWEPAIFHTPAGKVAGLAFSMTLPHEFWATDSTGGTAYPYESRLVNVLDSLEQEVDFIIVSFHWGTEKKEAPNDYQIYYARLAIDHGADLVLGHHPHVLQGFELYRNRLIAYSLGNLAFSSYSRVAVDGVLLRAVLQPEGLLFAQLYPLNVNNVEVEFQPQPADSAQRARIIGKLDSLSLVLNGRDIITDDGFILGSFQVEGKERQSKKVTDE